MMRWDTDSEFTRAPNGRTTETVRVRWLPLATPSQSGLQMPVATEKRCLYGRIRRTSPPPGEVLLFVM